MRGGLIILEGECVIARDALTVLVEIPQEERSVGIILGYRSTEPFNGGLIVLGGRVAGQEGLREAVLGIGIALFGAGLEVGDEAVVLR